MNKTIVSIIVGVGIVASASAMASDGTITINGKVTDSACDISIGGASDATVTLPNVSTSVLAAPGDVAGATPVAMALTNCPTTGSVRAFFEAQNVDMNTGHLLNTAASTPANNVQVQVVDQATGNAIDLRDNTNNPYVMFSSDGSANLNYSLQYYAEGAASAGSVESRLVYTLDYQ